MSMPLKIAEAQNTSKLCTVPALRYVNSSEYAKWDELVQTSPQNSVFCRSWWLNAVGEFRILGYFEGDELIAGIPLFFETRFGVRVCTMPRLTPTLGIVIQAMSGSVNKVAARQRFIIGEIAKKLSEYRSFFQAMHPTLVDWLPFYWAGFRQTTRYTYVIDDLSDLGRVWDGMNSNTHRQITKAEKAGIRIVPCGIDDVYKCEYESHLRRGTTPRTIKTFCGRSMMPRSNTRQALARPLSLKMDNYSRLGSWFADHNRAHGLVGGNNCGSRESAAGFLARWHHIQIAAERSQGYDFAGSMMEGVAQFNRGFGARQVPYHFIVKAPPLIHCGLQIAGKL